MDSPQRQRTVAQTVAVAGFGYWSGRDVRLEFRPAPADAGITFVRRDLPGQPRIPARVDHRVDVPRRTNLVAGNASVDMVEHVMAALAGLRIDNCEIWTDQAEMPGCDGSSLQFVNALSGAGISEQNGLKEPFVITETVRVGRGDVWVEAKPATQGEFHAEYRIEYDSNVAIGKQSASLTVEPASFIQEIAPARTFVTLQEAEAIHKQGLGRRVTPKDLLIFGDHGPIDNALRFKNECARHKLLDLVGDLALSGREFVGTFMAHKAGHRLHAELVSKLLRTAQVVQASRRVA